MSRATKRKHVLNEALQDYFTPPTENQEIVRIINSKGNNLHEIETSTKNVCLVSMPTKFRKTIWVKRGDFVIVESIEEGNKVKAEMVRVLSKEHIKYFKKINVWPKSFDTKFDKDSEEDLENTNNVVRLESESSDSSDYKTESSTESEEKSENE